ncbi:MAG: hypothetical protein AAF721_33475 [Myxococcota bacterium]
MLGCGTGERSEDGFALTTITAATAAPDGETGDAAATEGDSGDADGSDGADDPFGEEGPPATGGPALPDPDDEDCAALSEEATSLPAPVDIIVVVDNSGSMGEEAAAVQANLNGFSQQIVDAGIDVHVVLLSSYPGNGNGICIAPPLGAGGCPAIDNNPPSFTHINQEVGSGDALFQILGHHGGYAGVVRPDSIKHIVVVSDDNSAMPGFLFDSAFKDLDPSYEPYVLHGIVALHDCSDAADVGQAYIELAGLTGGVLGELCDQSFQPVFDQLSTEVIATTPLGCSWEIPPPPAGLELDPDAVNVELDDAGNVQTIGHIEGAWLCDDVDNGWFYDDDQAPTRIHVCPQTCAMIQAASEARIDILFGCATQSAPPAG